VLLICSKKYRASVCHSISKTLSRLWAFCCQNSCTAPFRWQKIENETRPEGCLASSCPSRRVQCGTPPTSGKTRLYGRSQAEITLKWWWCCSSVFAPKQGVTHSSVL